MTLPRRDRIATLYVAVAVGLYGLWLGDISLPGLEGVRAVGLVILALGFAASATAVVPAFEELLHGSKTYLGVMSLIGLGATAAGIRLMLTSSGAMLAVVVGAMVVMWIAATIRHTRLAAETAHEQPREDVLARAA